MLIGMRQLVVAVLAGAAVLGTARPSNAQFRVVPTTGGYSVAPYYAMYNRMNGYNRMYGYNPYGYGYNRFGYNPYGYGFGYNPYLYGINPYGGYLNGAANVVNAQGQYLINSQQAYLLKEQVRGAQLQNRRKAYDEFLYEKSLTPSLNDKRVLEQQQELRRALTNPPETEIWSAKSLNDLLTHTKTLQAKGVELRDVPLNPNTLRQINLTTKQVGNVGLLKDAGRLNWPLGLQILKPEDQATELRAQIDSLLLEGKKQAGNTGRVDPGIVVNLTKDVHQLRNMLVSRVSEYSFNDYTQAKNYLRQLDEAVKILQQPDAGNYFNGKYQAKGDNVGELVKYMTDNGLKFAPAIPGEEAAYSGLFAAMCQYYLGSGSTIQTQPVTRDFYRGLYEKTRMYQNGGQNQTPNPLPPLPPPTP